MQPYLRDPARIYRESFRTVRAEARLGRFEADMEPVAIRLIHACGMVEVADRLVWSERAVEGARLALANGAPVLCDCTMLAAGIVRRGLPARNDVVVTLGDARVPALAGEMGNTRSAAAVELWRDRLQGAVVAIGN
ncbi:MAG: precorrin-8X methylmutase, partial [Paracoccaceae bacterium]